MMTTRRNHYVPIWYQRRFLPSGQGSFFYLDLHPDRKSLPDGSVITMKDVHLWGPKKCFFEEDLYTTTIFGKPNDEVEKYLFGSIDQYGSQSIDALVRQDFQQLYKLFTKAFEYLDAQKTRTPKGLAWIKSHYPNLDQIQLMVEMQHLRQMHCTMWVEAVREIVSAEDSVIKFIIADHPVTIFNPACPPDSSYCRYPNDPSIALKASQTLFPLDRNHCLILTNLEYAREPSGVDPLSDRTHARYFGNTLVKFDTMIRSRKLKDEEVVTINLILKSRARKFIAAEKKEWLFPENIVYSSWAEMGKVLLPPNNELWGVGGEIYVGGKDGKLAHYQDEYGRTLGEISVLKKKHGREEPGRNDPCSCGSGKKYKKCCHNKASSERSSSEVYSIRERNIILLNAATDILGLSKGKTWEDVRRELSDEQVRKIYKVFGSLWPHETNLADLLPHPDSSILRALYTGIVDPRTILRNVTGLTLYFDEIIVLSPFINPANLREEYNPIKAPAQYKQEVLKNILLLIQLAPFIETGIVHLIPDPGDFDFQLRKTSWEMAKERLKNWKPSKEEIKKEELFFEEDSISSLWSLPEEALARKIREAEPTVSDEEIKGTIEYIKNKQIQDPLALLQPLLPGEENARLQIGHFGPNLEIGLYLSQITGSLVYTNSLHRWGEIRGSLNTHEMQKENGWEVFTESLSNLRFTFLDPINPQEAFTIRQSGKLGNIRKFLRQIWGSIQSDHKPESVPIITQRFSDELKEVYLKTEAEWRSIKKELESKNKDNAGQARMTTVNGTINCVIPGGGFGLNTVYRLLMSHSRRTDYLRHLPMAVFIEFHKIN